MLQIPPNARTTPVTRAEIAGSHERSGVLAQRYGVSTETIRKWRKRGAADCLDHAARPHQLPWQATEAERTIVGTLRRITNFALDDLTFVVTHFLPHLNRDSIWRILKAEASIVAPSQHRRNPPKARAPSRTMTSALSISTSSTCPSGRPPMVSGANAISMSPSTAAHAWSISLSRTTKPKPVPSLSCAKRPLRFPFA